jgi:voltage-dependent potassium channel beta subunit
MNYRHLGKSGLRISELSLGAWLTYGGQVGEEIAEKCMIAAYDSGVNFFDNAEGYSNGNAEVVVGNVLKKLGWKHESYIISTKIYWGGKGPNEHGLSYKHIIEGVNKSLRRFQLEYVDLVFCHRYDPETPIEEVVWAMNQVIQQGKAFYWGTSEWPAASIMRADAIARQNGLRPPSMEQPQYNMIYRERVEKEFKPLFSELGIGTTTWSPLLSGLLTGKYIEGIPEGSRLTLESMGWARGFAKQEDVINKIRNIKSYSDELGIPMSQLALAWCLKNPDVSTVITGASRVEQVHQNMKAIELAPQLTPEIMLRIDNILGNKPENED